MRNLFIMSGFFFFSLGALAQIDKSTTTVKAPEGLSIPQPSSETDWFKPSGNHSLSKKHSMLPPSKSFSLDEEEKSFSMRTDNGLIEYRMENFTPKTFKDKQMQEQYRRDQYLGDLVTGGEYVELYCRDHEFVDGDRVSVYINGKLVHNSIYLGGGYRPIMVRLNAGFNSIVFEALNQGSSGPNTAELRVLDDRGIEVAKKEWNLATGNRAKMVVVKK